MNDYLMHYAKGQTARQHKYVKKVGNRYYYEEDARAHSSGGGANGTFGGGGHRQQSKYDTDSGQRGTPYKNLVRDVRRQRARIQTAKNGNYDTGYDAKMQQLAADRAEKKRRAAYQAQRKDRINRNWANRNSVDEKIYNKRISGQPGAYDVRKARQMKINSSGNEKLIRKQIRNAVYKDAYDIKKLMFDKDARNAARDPEYLRRRILEETYKRGLSARGDKSDKWHARNAKNIVKKLFSKKLTSASKKRAGKNFILGILGKR